LEIDFLIWPHQGWAPQRNARHVRKLGAPTQRKARPQVGRPNARPQRKCKARPHVRNLGAPTQRKARREVGRPNAMQGEFARSAPKRNARQFARWAPKLKTHPQRKRPHKGALGEKTTWRMDKNKFWLGGRLFNTASPSLGTPNAMRGASARWVPKRNARRVRKMGAQMKYNATKTLGAPTQCKAHPEVGRPNATKGSSARWAPKRNARHVGTSANWAPQRNARHVRKMVAQTQNSSATKTYTQGSSRLKDELEDG
jgi:hypothetical protein